MEKVKLVQCYHCYALSDHKKPKCPHLSRPQRCPRCTQLGHKSWQCQNPTSCLHCGGPHPVTAPCCPLYQEKLNSVKIDLLKELLPNFHVTPDLPNNEHDIFTSTSRTHNFSNQSNSDALNLLMTSASTADGSFINFINSLFTASFALSQTNSSIIPYSPYSLPLVYNCDWEASSHCLTRSNSSFESIASSEDLEKSPVPQETPYMLTPASEPPLSLIFAHSQASVPSLDMPQETPEPTTFPHFKARCSPSCCSRTFSWFTIYPWETINLPCHPPRSTSQSANPYIWPSFRFKSPPFSNSPRSNSFWLLYFIQTPSHHSVGTITWSPSRSSPCLWGPFWVWSSQNRNGFNHRSLQPV